MSRTTRRSCRLVTVQHARALPSARSSLSDTSEKTKRSFRTYKCTNWDGTSTFHDSYLSLPSPLCFHHRSLISTFLIRALYLCRCARQPSGAGSLLCGCVSVRLCGCRVFVSLALGALLSLPVSHCLRFISPFGSQHTTSLLSLLSSLFHVSFSLFFSFLRILRSRPVSLPLPVSFYRSLSLPPSFSVLIYRHPLVQRCITSFSPAVSLSSPLPVPRLHPPQHPTSCYFFQTNGEQTGLSFHSPMKVFFAP